MTEQGAEEESYNPWTVVNAVFQHLVDEGLHPVLGASGNPGEAATQLLLCLGIQPRPEGNARLRTDIQDQLAKLRSAVLGES